MLKRQLSWFQNNVDIFEFIFAYHFDSKQWLPACAIFGIQKFLEPAVNLNDPDLIKDVLIKDHFSFHVNEIRFDEKADPLMSLNPFGATHDTWRKARNVLTPLLTLFKVILSIWSSIIQIDKQPNFSHAQICIGSYLTSIAYWQLFKIQWLHSIDTTKQRHRNQSSKLKFLVIVFVSRFFNTFDQWSLKLIKI